MKKVFLIFIIFNLWCAYAWAQQGPRFSQFMLNKTYWSPALVGLDAKTNVSLFSRSQWTGYTTSFDNTGRAPVTQFLGFEMPVSIKKQKLGFGMNLIHDELGVEKNVAVQATLAWHKKIRKGQLSFAVRPEMINQTIGFNELIFVNSEDPFASNEEQSLSAFDLGAGLAFSTKELVLGLGLNHLLRPNMSHFSTGEEGAKKKISANLYVEYNYRITYKVDIKPSILVTTNIDAFSLDLGFISTYGDKLWGGLTYRNSEAMVFLMGYSFLKNQKLKVGYSFDYVVHDQSAKEPTSHELYLKYDLPSLTKGDKKIIRTPRFRY